MDNINTTSGLFPINQLGRVNIHEHIILDATNNKQIPDDFHHVDVEILSEDLLAWKNSGGGAIVDSSPIGAGRNIKLLEKLSALSKVPVIVTTGFHKLSYYPHDHWLFSATEEDIYKIILDETEKGVLIQAAENKFVNRSKIKAHMMKFGFDDNKIIPILEKIIYIIGTIIKETNIPCMIHTEPGSPFETILNLLEKHHLPPNKIIFCHMGKSLNRHLYISLAEQGYFLEFDEMVRSAPPIEILAAEIMELFKHNLGKSVLFAGDLARRSYWKCYGGNPGLEFLVTELDKKLYVLGFSQDTLDQIWISNPKVLFS